MDLEGVYERGAFVDFFPSFDFVYFWGVAVVGLFFWKLFGVILGLGVSAMATAMAVGND